MTISYSSICLPFSDISLALNNKIWFHLKEVIAVSDDCSDDSIESSDGLPVIESSSVME